MNVRLPRLVAANLLLAMALFVSGCAAQHQTAGGGNFNDPFESTNRKIFAFNQAVDRHVLVPAAKAYRTVLPDPVRDSVRDFLRNLRSPLILANDLLQGNFPHAGDTLARFLLNSTIGIGGIVDVASRWGIPFHDEDLGLTLAVWGVPEGPYLVIPVLGPSNPRDFGGQVAEGFGDPWNIVATDNGYMWIPFVRGAVGGIDERSRYIETLADLERTSLDYYATIRSLYRQRRAALVREDKKLPPNPGLTRKGHPEAVVASAKPPAPAPDPTSADNGYDNGYKVFP